MPELSALERYLVTLRDKRALHPENASRYDPLIRDAERQIATLEALRRSAA